MKRFWPELCHPADWMLSPFALLIPEQTESGASAVVARQGSAKLERQVIAPGYHYVDSNQMAKLTSESILNYLDTCVEASFFNFMELDHPYFHTANSRLSLFADQENWATVFERSAYSDGSWSLELELSFFRSTLRNLDTVGSNGQHLSNQKRFELVSEKDLEKVEEVARFRPADPL